MQFEVLDEKLYHLRRGFSGVIDNFLYLTCKSYRESNAPSQKRKLKSFIGEVIKEIDESTKIDISIFLRGIYTFFNSDETLELMKKVLSSNNVKICDQNIRSIITGNEFCDDEGDISEETKEELHSFFQSNPENYEEGFSPSIRNIYYYLHNRNFSGEPDPSNEEDFLKWLALMTDFNIVIIEGDETILFQSLRESNPFILIRFDPAAEAFYGVGEMRGNGIYHVFRKESPIIEKILSKNKCVFPNP